MNYGMAAIYFETREQAQEMLQAILDRRLA
jgi:hypothetical protein